MHLPWPPSVFLIPSEIGACVLLDKRFEWKVLPAGIGSLIRSRNDQGFFSYSAAF